MLLSWHSLFHKINYMDKNFIQAQELLEDSFKLSMASL